MTEFLIGGFVVLFVGALAFYVAAQVHRRQTGKGIVETYFTEEDYPKLIPEPEENFRTVPIELHNDVTMPIHTEEWRKKQ